MAYARERRHFDRIGECLIKITMNFLPGMRSHLFIVMQKSRQFDAATGKDNTMDFKAFLRFMKYTGDRTGEADTNAETGAGRHGDWCETGTEIDAETGDSDWLEAETGAGDAETGAETGAEIDAETGEDESEDEADAETGAEIDAETGEDESEDEADAETGASDAEPDAETGAEIDAETVKMRVRMRLMQRLG